MNKARRKVLSELLSEIEDIKERLSTVLDEEREAYGNLSEGFQNGEKGEAMQNGISSMEDAFASLESAESELQNAQGD